MSYQKGEKDFGEQPKTHRIRITLTSRNVKALEKVCSELIERARSKDLQAKGPTPCGEGSKTWDIFELRIHKRLIDLRAATEAVKAIIVNVEAGVEVEVTIAA